MKISAMTSYYLPIDALFCVFIIFSNAFIWVGREGWILSMERGEKEKEKKKT